MVAITSVTVANVVHRIRQIHEVRRHCKPMSAGCHRHEAKEHESSHQRLCEHKTDTTVYHHLTVKLVRYLCKIYVKARACRNVATSYHDWWSKQEHLRATSGLILSRHPTLIILDLNNTITTLMHIYMLVESFSALASKYQVAHYVNYVAMNDNVKIRPRWRTDTNSKTTKT